MRRENVLRPDDPCELLIFPNTVLTPPAGLAASQCTNPALIGFSDSRSSDKLYARGDPAILMQAMTPCFMLELAKVRKLAASLHQEVADPEDLEYNDEKALGYEIGLKSKTI